MTISPERSTTGQSGHVQSTGGNLARSAAAVPVDAATARFAGFRCGNCGSEEIQKLSVVYESGTSVINARTSGTSTGFGFARGGMGVGTAFNSSRTTGTQMSELAKRAAPPKGRSTAGWVVAGLAGGVLLMLFGGVGGVILLLPICGYGAYQANKYNAEVLPGLRAAWDQSWLRHRCGTVSRIQP